MKKYLLALALGACSTTEPAQDRAPIVPIIPTLPGIPAETRPKQTLMTVEVFSPENDELATEAGIQKTMIFNGNAIDVNNDGIWDGPALMDKAIVDAKLDASYSGYLSLDWEGTAMKKLNAGDEATQKQYLLALRYVKSKLPKAKVGYYAFPKTTFWGGLGLGGPCMISDACGGDVVAKINSYYKPILDESGVYFPSLYTYYPDSLSNGGQKAMNLNFMTWNAMNTIRLRGDKTTPIFVFINPRYHPAGSPKPTQQQPIDEFSGQMSALLGTSFEGKKIQGLYWWGADRWYATVGAKGIYPAEPFLKIECGADTANWLPCVDAFQTKVIEALREVMRKANTK